MRVKSHKIENHNLYLTFDNDRVAKFYIYDEQDGKRFFDANGYFMDDQEPCVVTVDLDVFLSSMMANKNIVL